MFIRDPLRRGLAAALVLLFISAGCSKKSSSTSSDEDVDDVYSEDSPSEPSPDDGDPGPGASADTAGANSKNAAKSLSVARKALVADPEAARLIEKMRKTYAECKSYEDVGEVMTRTKFYSDDDDDDYRILNRQKFFTNFVRPDCLRMQLVTHDEWEHKDIIQVWQVCGKEGRSFGDGGFSLGDLFSHSDDEEEAAPLSDRDRALLNASSVSVVPALLMPPEAKGRKKKSPRGDLGVLFSAFDRPQLEHDEKVDKKSCYKVTGPVKSDEVARIGDVLGMYVDTSETKYEAAATFWIDKKLNILRKFQFVLKMEDLGDLNVPGAGAIEIPDTTKEITATFQPRINIPQRWIDVGLGLGGNNDEPDVDGRIFGGKDFKPYTKSRKVARSFGRKQMNAMLKKFAECSTYTDSGVMTLRDVDRNTGIVKTVNFETAFKREGDLRYLLKFKNEKGDSIQYMSWSNGSEHKDWFSESDQTITFPSQRELVNDLGNMRGMPGRLVLGLLNPDGCGESEVGKPLGPIMLGYETIDGASCYFIQARGAQKRWVFYWIDTKSKALRRLETFDPGVVAHQWVTIDFDAPQFDKKIPGKKLSFTERGE